MRVCVDVCACASVCVRVCVAHSKLQASGLLLEGIQFLEVFTVVLGF